ncbi:FCD domain-containing protein [Yinghuangia sp. ASG 101]|uniref:FadR/GntR family transcriptional regulator n=1 Tax=Yinghuangia sp. ASG 101 TaxID=2896848 RepID=UPI001E53F688|nr:FCD domain-containing protein [Yinghuangia sp. ASG 101]UGQ11596.1 FCD domain-containing protein [Yinghuangia sp. ASG 101]
MNGSRPQKTALLVAQRIVADINERGNTAGDRLPPERTMVEEYEVGRGTLRESLRYLEFQGVIKLRPGPSGGPIVQQPDGSALAGSLSLLLQFHKASFQDIVESRSALEPAMARLAAERMTDDEIAELGRILDDERETVKEQAQFLRQTRRFHVTLAQGSRNALFSMLFAALNDILDGASMGVDYSLRQRKATTDIHAGIREAIIARDADLAERLMTQHMDALTQYTQKHYAESMAQPVVWGG